VLGLHEKGALHAKITLRKLTMNILLIRRDNIGDMVCTTPLIAGIAEQLEPERLDVLTNSYVAPILEGVHVISRVYCYTKAKHLGLRWFEVILQRFKLVRELRAVHYDIVIAFDQRAARFAKFLRYQRLIKRSEFYDDPLAEPPHEVNRAWRLGAELGLRGEPGPLTLRPPCQNHPQNAQSVIGFHISARRPTQRPSTDQILEVVSELKRALPHARIRMLWSPGSQDSKTHPGDDEKAQFIKSKCDDPSLEPYPTQTLQDLQAAIRDCQIMIMPDGGAMHIAAGLGKPICALFAESNESRWGPWGVPSLILKRPRQPVSAIPSHEIVRAALDLYNKRQMSHGTS
jgi:heptosyltransferase-3